MNHLVNEYNDVREAQAELGNEMDGLIGQMEYHSKRHETIWRELAWHNIITKQDCGLKNFCCDPLP
jgi:predicted metal-dependent hydrolase